MWMLPNVFLCTFIVVVAQEEVMLEADRPYLKVQLNGPAELECCYTFAGSLTATWVIIVNRNVTISLQSVKYSDLVITGERKKDTEKGSVCGILLLKSVQMGDAGLYLCWLNNSNINTFSHGTYLHVYTPLRKTINLYERTKNKILTAEGILLLLCVLLPAATILCKKKRLYELEKKKVTKETENIYQGLNLDECCPKYDQIERPHHRGSYQDVRSASEVEDFQLEKPGAK